MPIHDNSKEAHRTNVYTARHKAIVETFRKFGPQTDRQVAERLGYADMNKVRPRVNELRDMGIIVERTEPTKCHVTGKSVRVCYWPTPADNLLTAIRAGCEQPGLFDALVSMVKPRYEEWPK